MNKKHFLAYAILITAIIIIVVKYSGYGSSKPQPKTDQNIHPNSSSATSREKETEDEKTTLHSPFGKLRYKEHVPQYPLIDTFKDYGFLDEDTGNVLNKRGINPWQVHLDDEQNVVKFTIREAIPPTVNLNDRLLADFQEQGYEMVGRNKINFKLDDKELMQQLYKTLLDRFYLHKSTKAGGEIRPNEYVIYPVIARYHGQAAPTDIDANQAYLQGKEMLMLLIIYNRGYPDKLDYFGDESTLTMKKYGFENCMDMLFNLTPLPRNQAEAEWYKKAPRSSEIGVGFRAYTPTVEAWERVNGKKYVDK
jgi:hypothetical protein